MIRGHKELIHCRARTCSLNVLVDTTILVTIDPPIWRLHVYSGQNLLSWSRTKLWYLLENLKFCLAVSIDYYKISVWDPHSSFISSYWLTYFVTFSELIAWYGIAVAGQHLCMYLAWLVMVSYLSGRSHQTQLWYQKKIENFPKDRRNLFPGIYWSNNGLICYKGIFRKALDLRSRSMMNETQETRTLHRKEISVKMFLFNFIPNDSLLEERTLHLMKIHFVWIKHMKPFLSKISLIGTCNNNYTCKAIIMRSFIE